jgi:hypothetical protein
MTAARKTWPADRATKPAPPMPPLLDRKELSARLMRMAVEVREGWVDETRMTALAGCLDEVEIP